jgi:L-seryl-tRNA(Ser) seleniumtransferase
MLNETQRKHLRQIPAVHDLLLDSEIKKIEVEEEISKEFLTVFCQESIQEFRDGLLSGIITEDQDILKYLVKEVRYKADNFVDSPLKPLINGTGVILHTNLGRAKLSNSAQKELTKVASYYSNLEFKLDEGIRGSRHSLVEQLICQLTGAEAALVCNNNAAAVFLTLRELAQYKEVIVSRGELVEIGGSFRISEIMKESGAKLVEVGTTNKTHLYDYERNITSETGLIMKVHTSNFVISGFTSAVPGVQLVDLAHQHHIPVFEDLGSGVLMDLRPYGIGQEPTVQEVIAEGVDIVSFSGDKLLGGPQAGIIAGKKEYIDRLKRNQLMRSLRVDKFTLAALHATLKQYLHPNKAISEIPTLHMILQSVDEVRNKAMQFISKLDSLGYYSAELTQTESEVGGGTMPDVKIPSWAVELTSQVDRNVAALSKRLRMAAFPVIGRIQNDRFILDFRTIAEDEIDLILSSLQLNKKND